MGCGLAAEGWPSSSLTTRWDRPGHTKPSAAQEWGLEVAAHVCCCPGAEDTGSLGWSRGGPRLGQSSGDVPAFPKAHKEQHLPEGTPAQGPPGCPQVLSTEPCWGPMCGCHGVEWAGPSFWSGLVGAFRASAGGLETRTQSQQCRLSGGGQSEEGGRGDGEAVGEKERKREASAWLSAVSWVYHPEIHPRLCSIFFYFLSAPPLQRSLLHPLLSVWRPQN